MHWATAEDSDGYTKVESVVATLVVTEERKISIVA